MRVVVSGVPRGYQSPHPERNWLQERHRRRIEALSPDVELVEVPQGEVHDVDGKVEGVKMLLAERGNRVPLWDMENVFVIPHDSHSSPYIGDRIIEIFYDNLGRYLRGEPLVNVCDPNRGY